MAWLEVVLLVACHVLCAFFAGMETGVVSLSRLRLLHLARGGDRRARLLAEYIRDPDRLLGTMLVGSNIASVAISILAASLARRAWGGAGLGASTAVSATTILVFGEFFPKAWFASRPLSRCLPLAGLLRAAEAALKPLSRSLMALTDLFLPDAGAGGAAAGHAVTREHLRWLARNSEVGGQISPLESLMISRALALQSKTAADVMTPLPAVHCLAAGGTLADVSRLAAATGLNKFPVLGGDGCCQGVLYVQDVLARIAGNPGDKVLDFARKPFYVSADARADDILPFLRRNGQRLALVRDAAGKLLGIVTIDAILGIVAGNLPRDATGDRAADRDAAVVFNASGREV